MYENNFEFIDNWIAIHNMRSRNMLHQKFEWNVGSDYETMRDGIIQIRQSGIRVKRPNYFPSLVVMRNTPLVWDKNKCHYRFITPREASKLQSFDDGFLAMHTSILLASLPLLPEKRLVNSIPLLARLSFSVVLLALASQILRPLRKSALRL